MIERMLPIVRLYPNQRDSEVAEEHRTFHGSLGSCRVPPNGAALISNGDVLAVGNRGAWELRGAGIARLLEELDEVPAERRRGRM